MDGGRRGGEELMDRWRQSVECLQVSQEEGRRKTILFYSISGCSSDFDSEGEESIINLNSRRPVVQERRCSKKT